MSPYPTARARTSITTLVLTFNEELHIERCLVSAARVSERLVVVDSFSTDHTVEIAERFGASVYRHPFTNQAAQVAWALAHCNITSDWVLRLDADEYLEPHLVEEIVHRVPDLAPDVTGVVLKRKLIFRGKWIRFGGYYPTSLLRLWRNGMADVEHAWMDEHMVLREGRAVRFDHDFCDHNLRDLTWWIEKHNRYATRKMVDAIVSEFRLNAHLPGTRPRAAGLRAARRALYRLLPLHARSVMYFIYRYGIRLGFLDGTQGFLWHVLQGFWYHLLVDMKISEAREHIASHGIDAFRRTLAEQHGIEL